MDDVGRMATSRYRYRDVSIAAIACSRTSLETQTAVMCVCLQRRRVRHNANYVPYAQIPDCPLSSRLLESLQPHSRLQWRFRDKGLIDRPSTDHVTSLRRLLVCARHKKNLCGVACVSAACFKKQKSMQRLFW